jgi:hypothetical protein
LPQSTKPLVAVHQPNFFPWLGYFDKLARADVFVLLDDAQFPKKGGTWVNRVRMLINGSPAWVTLPVDRSYHGFREIREMRIKDSVPWREKMRKTIQASYGKTRHFARVFEAIRELIENPTNELAVYNTTAIRTLASALGLNPGKLVNSSECGVQGTGTERLVSLVKAVDGGAYLAGGGAAGYQRDELFAEAEIELVAQEFRHPHYPQTVEPAVEGLSIIDALMNCGFDGTAALLGISESEGLSQPPRDPPLTA